MEAPEKEVHSFSKISSERSHHIEAQEEETAPNFLSKVHPWSKKVISGGKRVMEEKEKEEVPLQVRS